MKDPRGDPLDAARHEAGLALSELWLRYFDLGGNATALMLDAWLQRVLIAPRCGGQPGAPGTERAAG